MVTANAWPAHWNHSKGKVICIVCGALVDQFVIDIVQHADSHQDPAHRIFSQMLRQTQCAYCENRPLRKEAMISFFKHELKKHETVHMSTIPGFIRLTRLGLTGQAGIEAHEAIYQLMIMKLQHSYWAARELFVRAGYPEPSPREVPIEALAAIISPREHRPGGSQAPEWTPILPEDFLKHLEPRPVGDERWKICWDYLREFYKRGDL